MQGNTTPIGLAAIAAASIAAFASTSNAGIILTGEVGESAETTGANYTAELSYIHIAGNSGQLTIALTNTTPLSVGGFLTAFVFNFGSADLGASGSLASTTDPHFLDAAGESANPFGGSYIAGAGLLGNFEGGGSPANGIHIGDTATFVFNITASDAAALSDLSFLEGPYERNFVVRFRGLDDGGSDKVPAMLVPAPGAIAFTALAAGIAARRRRAR
ncbi:MAG: hypothetical protein ACTS3F_01575 [Phycisphaerales bacterium]